VGGFSLAGEKGSREGVGEAEGEAEGCQEGGCCGHGGGLRVRMLMKMQKWKHDTWALMLVFIQPCSRLRWEALLVHHETISE
jgi:hypothetical protein